MGKPTSGSVSNSWVGLGPERRWAWPLPGLWAVSGSIPLQDAARSRQTPVGREAGRSLGNPGRGPDELSCSLQIRSDTSQILEENIPLLQAKVTEMRGIYAKVNQLEVGSGP